MEQKRHMRRVTAGEAVSPGCGVRRERPRDRQETPAAANGEETVSRVGAKKERCLFEHLSFRIEEFILQYAEVCLLDKLQLRFLVLAFPLAEE